MPLTYQFFGEVGYHPFGASVVFRWGALIGRRHLSAFHDISHLLYLKVNDLTITEYTRYMFALSPTGKGIMRWSLIEIQSCIGT